MYPTQWCQHRLWVQEIVAVTLGEHNLLKSGLPSRTALAAAAHRAAHQVLEYGCIFDDPLALRILGKDAETAIREAETHPSKRWMRIFIAIRTRFAEDALAAAVEKGVTQLVILGAGLDTFAYRNPFGERLRAYLRLITQPPKPGNANVLRKPQ